MKNTATETDTADTTTITNRRKTEKKNRETETDTEKRETTNIEINTGKRGISVILKKDVTRERDTTRKRDANRGKVEGEDLEVERDRGVEAGHRDGRNIEEEGRIAEKRIGLARVHI